MGALLSFAGIAISRTTELFLESALLIGMINLLVFWIAGIRLAPGAVPRFGKPAWFSSAGGERAHGARILRVGRATSV